MLCHAQSISRPIAPRVNFGLRLLVKYRDTLGRQKNANFYYLDYIDHDENNGANYVKFWQVVLQLAC